MSDSFFLEPPSGIDIARYLFDETDRQHDSEGITLFREGTDYCYLWIASHIDHDMRVSYLLDIRTRVDAKPGEFGETRDFLFVNGGGGGKLQVEWQNEPIAFTAPAEAHRDRTYKGLLWFVNRDDQSWEYLE